ncbi:hypothetical protein BpHYR1_004028 [Brachionus plicatilis]|uniref:Uncharacterized protein n=1 Tax=Brachionus plicatilis TaxID=10195 RepID=A0A3M7T3I5_BRAPC|nr:hypothetical protein BpHYR1_004028 [Brachionus plicatilis]
MINFGYKIINFANSAPLLKEQFIRNRTKNLNYNLRNENDFIQKEARTKSGEKTFGFIFTRLGNKSITKREDLLAQFKRSDSSIN